MVRKGIEAKYESLMFQDGSGTWGFRLILDEKVRIQGEGYSGHVEAEEAAKKIGLELALIVVGI